MKIVTAGSAYMDIDAYGGCIAYAELLNICGKNAVACSTAPFSFNITTKLLSLGKRLSTYSPDSNDEFILIDISNLEYLDPIVKIDSVIEVIDHHPGHEAKWKTLLGNSAQIEPIGAACTLVIERWIAAGKLNQMDPNTAQLLAAGILDNTLNFTAAITKDRDHKAYELVAQIAGLTADYIVDYFLDCQAAIEANVTLAIKNDMKLITETDLLPKVIGQLVVWDSMAVLRDNKQEISDVMSSYNPDWVMDVISISESKMYFLSTNKLSQNKLTSLFGLSFKSDIAEFDTVMLRKEILRFALDKA